MKTNILGYPRIGERRELKRACEAYWDQKISVEELLEQGKELRKKNWQLQKAHGIDMVPSNDFSFYDQVLDMTLMMGAIPSRYNSFLNNKLDLYFAMARGCQKDGQDVIAMEMTKWFDANYHYIVPEFSNNQEFVFFDDKAVCEYEEAKVLGIETKPVIIGPMTYLLLGKEKGEGFHRVELINNLLPAYLDLLKALEMAGAEWIQIDEPFLTLDLEPWIQKEYLRVFSHIRKHIKAKIMLATYFEGFGKENISLVRQMSIDALHIDLVRDPQQLDIVLDRFPINRSLSLGVVDGRNVWKNDFEQSLALIHKAKEILGEERLFVAGSSSFLYVPYDLDLERCENVLTPEIKQWMAYAKQKITEVEQLAALAGDGPTQNDILALIANRQAIALRKTSPLVHNAEVKQRVASVDERWACRNNPYSVRTAIQRDVLHLPFLPTTTIGSFPQTPKVRSWRSSHRKGELSDAEYETLLKEEIEHAVRWQEEIGVDVFVHGEFERNDMVEYFGEQLDGFTFSHNGWVQSYGSRCVKPPIIYGDICRPYPMTVKWSVFAQSLTSKWMKGMLTGPVTILQWSFVRNDQPRETTCRQLALAIRDEVCDLEKAGIKIIQIDEPALREGLPLLKINKKAYLDWAVECFCLSASGVQDVTQIHTHMCYCEFNDILEYIARMDADVITIECSRSQMELLDGFAKFKYPNEIGPGVYDIHSPRVPSVDEMVSLLRKAAAVIPPERLWINPDCGLKTRKWPETEASLKQMVQAAEKVRIEFR